MTTQSRWTLVVVSVATAMLMLDISVVNTALPGIGRDLDADLTDVQWVVDAYTLPLAAVVLTAGSLADRLGRKRMLVAGFVLFTVSSLACALSDSMTALNVARAFQGAGGAVLFAVSLAVLAHAFPRPAERASALAGYGAVIGASFAVGPLVGGALTDWLDWRSIFLINVPIGIVALWLTKRWVAESRDAHPRPIDWSGQVAIGAALALLVHALLRGNEEGWGSTQIVLELAGAAVATAAFLLLQARKRMPMLPLSSFRSATFTGAQISAFAVSASMFAIFLYMTLYLQNVVGLSPIEAGLVYMPATLVSLFVSGATAKIQQRIALRTLVVLGLVLVSAGLALGLLTQADSSWTVLLPATIVGLVGVGILNPTISSLALSSLPEEDSGLAAGANDTFRQTGIAVGTAALGALLPHGAGMGLEAPQAFVDGLHDALIVGAAVAAAGAAASWVVLRGTVAARVPSFGRAPVPEAA